MPPPFKPRVTQARRIAAWAFLGLLLALGLFALQHQHVHPAVLKWAKAGLWISLGYLAIRAAAFLLLDPLLRHRKTETPGFARDLILVVLYAALGVEILRRVVQVDIAALLGTGAIVAAVVGLSLQETLGNLFSGIALHLDPAFRVGDWVEISGNLRGGDARDTFIGQVMAITWRSVQLRTENGDTDVFPNRLLAQAVITNLNAPDGLHRRTARVVVEPHPELHEALDRLTIALAGIPHPSDHPPEAVVRNYAQGGTVLELRFWALGFRHGRISLFHALRLASSVLPREGFALMGPCAPNPLHPKPKDVEASDLERMLRSLDLPSHWLETLRPLVRRRHAAPGEAIIRAGDPGDSLFSVLSGRLDVVRVIQRTEPYNGLFWESVATLHPGDWFGEASLLTGAPRSATVVADTPVVLAELPKEAFETCLAREPQGIEVLADLMAKRNAARASSEQGPASTSREDWMSQIRHWFRLTP